MSSRSEVITWDEFGNLISPDTVYSRAHLITPLPEEDIDEDLIGIVDAGRNDALGVFYRVAWSVSASVNGIKIGPFELETLGQDVLVLLAMPNVDYKIANYIISSLRSLANDLGLVETPDYFN